jgi:tRNA 2-thiouridine synthesizing protein A
MSETTIDVRGETCPVPLVETRKAIMNSSPGDIITVIGDHPTSMEEIPMAIESLELELLSIEGKGDGWSIRFRR